MEIYCENCKEKIDCDLKTGKDIYTHRPDLYHLKFWQCPICKKYVGTHLNSKNNAPLGTIPFDELKKARIKAHFYIDRLWKSGKISRSSLYKKLSDYFGFKYHNGTTRSVEECERAIAFIKTIESEE